jgi:serine/threonine protein kinase
MIKNEIRMLNALKNPAIVTIYELFQSDLYIMIIMEYSNGGTLYDRVAEHRPFSEAQAATLLKQIMDLLGYLHGKDIIHRDLKLESILLPNEADQEENRIKICPLFH